MKSLAFDELVELFIIEKLFTFKYFNEDKIHLKIKKKRIQS